MRIVSEIAGGDGFSLEQVRIRAEAPAWSEPEVPAGLRVTFVRRGVFRARVGGEVAVAEPAVAYICGPGEEQSIAHRAGVEDVCTSLVISRELAGEHRAARARFVPVTGDIAVAFRLLVSRARGDADAFEPAEMAVRLVGGLLGAEPSRPGPAAPRPRTEAARRRLAESAREILAREPAGLGLADVARLVGCSPSHLSRVFREQTGTTLTGYRTRIRVLIALDALDAGHRDLAGLAAALGFADHAHLSRAVRRECGRSPSALRHLLTRPN